MKSLLIKKTTWIKLPYQFAKEQSFAFNFRVLNSPKRIVEVVVVVAAVVNITMAVIDMVVVLVLLQRSRRRW